MARRADLPSRETIDAAWHEGPPGRLEDPSLYDGLALRRAAGYLIDAFVLLMVISGLWVLVILSLGLLLPVKLVITPLLPVAYHTWFIGKAGATPGMQIMDVEIRGWTGRRPDFLQALVMTALFYATVLPTSFLVLVVALFNDRQRTLHDYLAGTVGLRRSRLAAAGPPTI